MKLSGELPIDDVREFFLLIFSQESEADAEAQSWMSVSDRAAQREPTPVGQFNLKHDDLADRDLPERVHIASAEAQVRQATLPVFPARAERNLFAVLFSSLFHDKC
jgi:hypothetical protein